MKNKDIDMGIISKPEMATGAADNLLQAGNFLRLITGKKVELQPDGNGTYTISSGGIVYTLPKQRVC